MLYPVTSNGDIEKEKFSLFMGFMLKEADKKQLTKKFETMVIYYEEIKISMIRE